MKYMELKDRGVDLENLTSNIKLASDRLKAIEKIDTELFINALQSSALICLAGMRAQSPYHNFSKTVAPKKLHELNEQLYPLGLAIYSDALLPIRAGLPEKTDFSFINLEAMAQISNRYQCLSKISYPAIIDPQVSMHLAAGWHVQEFKLALIMSDDILPKTWLKDWFAPMNMRYGMELGYPGSAIASLLWNESEGKDSLLSILIDDLNEYDGTWVSFGYSKGTENNHDIKSTVTAWQQIIKELRQLYPTGTMLSLPAISKTLSAISS